MAKNLNIGTMISGNSHQLNNGVIEKYCYNGDTANCDVYGGLYQWDKMMQYVTTESDQGICPTSWHLPTDAEWMTLEEVVESSTGVIWNTTGWRGTDAGSNLKETGLSHWYNPNYATNYSSFTALPAGYRALGGGSQNQQRYGYWWSSSEYSTSYKWYRSLYYSYYQVERDITHKSNGCIVRCLKD